jgi:predicted HAD superfamily phosphohydrolase
MNAQQDLEKEAKQLGERLGLLLLSASLPDEVKEAIIVMIPEMTPEQIDSLIHMLEQNIAGTAEIEAREFLENIKSVEVAHQKEAKALQEKTLSDLEEIERLLDQSES